MKRISEKGSFILDLLIIVFTYVNIFAWAYVLTFIYGWFILYVFPDARVFTVREFIALWMFKTIIFVRLDKKLPKKYTEDEQLEINIRHLINLILVPWFALAGCWLIKTIFL